MIKERRDGLILLFLGALAFIVLGVAWRSFSLIEMGDYKVVYYSARCLIKNGDPYRQDDVLRVYHNEGRERANEPQLDTNVKTRFFYPPTAFLVTVPLAVMGFESGKLLWTVLSAGSLILAALLMWEVSAESAPLLAGAMLGFLLANSCWLFMIGNAAAMAVGFCAIATWCFCRERFPMAGTLCLAIALALKPNDAGLVWLFFLLHGGVLRKRAIQTLAVLAVLSLPLMLWVTIVAPHWPRELMANMHSFSGAGGLVDPAATGGMDPVVELQSALSVFFPLPATYSWITYVVCAPLLLACAFCLVRRKPAGKQVWMLLATIAPLSMLFTYHLQHDAKLIMLSVPACSMLWARRDRIARIAAVVTWAAVVINGDLFSFIRIVLTRNLLVPEPHFGSRLATVLLTRPAPLILLVLAVFFLIMSATRRVHDSIGCQSLAS